MPNQVPEEMKNARSAELIALGEKMSQEFREDYLNREVEVLFEEENVIDGNSYYVGYTKEYVKVAKVSEVPLENQFVKGILTQKLSEEIYLMQ